MILPLWDENPFEKQRLPLVSWGLIALNMAIFTYIASLPEDGADVIVDRFGITPPDLLRMFSTHDVLQPLTLFSAMFLHGSWVHLLGNMLFIWIFADDIEEVLGRGRFLLFYLAGGVLSGLIYALLSYDSTLTEIGASGAIAAILAAYVMYRPCKKVHTLVGWFVFMIDAYWLIGAWAVLQIVLGGLEQGDGVAYAAHVAGLVVGAALFAWMRPADVELFACFAPKQPPDAASGGVS